MRKVHSAIVETSDDLLTRFSNHHLVILGDFNHFNFNWLCEYFHLVDLVKDVWNHSLAGRRTPPFVCEVSEADALASALGSGDE